MKKNWPSSHPVIQSSSHPVAGQPASRPELDGQSSSAESLYPSRLTKRQINPRIPIDLYDELMDFVGINRQYKVESLVARGLRLALDEIAAARGRPATGHPVIQSLAVQSSGDRSDQIDPPDEVDPKLFGNQLSENQEIAGRPVIQPEAVEVWVALLAELRSRLSEEILRTWFSPIEVEKLDSSQCVLTLRTPNQIVKDFVVSEYGRVIMEAMNRTRLSGYSIRWKVGPTTGTSVDALPQPAKPPTAADFKDELLSLFSIVVQKNLEPRDGSDFDKVGHCSPDAVRYGILYSRLKAKEPIRNFCYCIKSIVQIEKAGLAAKLLPTLLNEVFPPPQQPVLPQFGANVEKMKRKERR
jgi:DnaA-like protein